MEIVTNSPSVVLENHIINAVSLDWGLAIHHSSSGILIDVHCSEVVELALVEVGQVPVKSDIFECEVVPVIVVWVVWDLVVMDVLSFQPGTSYFDQCFLLVSFLWSTFLVFV